MPAPAHLFIIGAQRSGTTRLTRLLDEHPDISFAKPLRPEPKFFLRDKWSSFSASAYRAALWPIPDPGHKTILAEKSTSYYEKPEVAERIYAVLPEAKIVCILRDPVERALSNYRFSRDHGLETRTLTQVFLDNAPAPPAPRQISTNPFDYLGRGEYARHLRPYFRLFGADKIHVLFFEDFNARPAEKLKALYSFLSLSAIEAELSSLHTVVNASRGSQLDPPQDVVQHLHRYYQHFNVQLRKLTGQDLPITWSG